MSCHPSNDGTPRSNENNVEGNNTFSNNETFEENAKPLTRKRMKDESKWGKNIQTK